MKLRASIFVLCCAFASSSGAQKTPSEVTDAQVREYKALAEKGCAEAGKAQGDPPQKVAEFCKCISSVFEKSLSREEWQRAYFYSKEGRAAEERNVFGPHESKIRACVRS